MSKRLPWFEVILIFVVLSMSLYAALSDGQNLSWRWFVRDDAYYYFKVAQNISEGQGSTFDGINKTNGYHPLWMLICIPIFALARFDLVLPLRVLLLVMGALSAATGILLYRMIGRIFTPAIGAAAALYWALSYEILAVVYQQGLETGIAAFFIVLLAYKLYEFEISWRRKIATDRLIIEIAIVAVLAMFSRLDLVFLAGMAGLWVVFRRSLLSYYLPLDIAVILIISLLAFLIRVGSVSAYYADAHVAILYAGLSLVIKIASAFLLGLYQKSVLSKPALLLKRIFILAVIGSLLPGALTFISLRTGIWQGSFSPFVPVIDFVLCLVVFGINRLMFTGLQTSGTSSHDDQSPIEFFCQNWRQWFSDGRLYFGIVLGSLGIYMLWNHLAFGTSSPVSGQIKRWWASLPGRAYGGVTQDILSFFGISYHGDANAWNPVSRLMGQWAERYQFLGLIDMWRYFLLLIAFAIVFYLLFFIQRNKAKTSLTQLGILPLFFSSWLQVLYYHALGYSAFKNWYWTTQVIVVVLTMSFVVGMSFTRIRKFPYAQAVPWVLAAGVALYFGIPTWNQIHRNMEYNVWSPDDPYMDIVPLLEANTEPGSLIGFTGGGNPGYFVHDRTVVNMDGLINSYPYFQALQAGQAGAFLEAMGLDYVLANRTILSQQPYNGQFDEYMQALDVSYGGKQLLRYGKP